MPLKPGSSRETISDNIQETLESPTFGEGKGKKKRREMAAAAALRSAGKPRKGKRKLSREALKKGGRRGG